MNKRISGAAAMVRMLHAYDVEVLFGLCGDTSLPFYDALRHADSRIRHVLTRDERHAAYMADCYARVSGRVGVCEGPSGGGATYLLPGLAEANESSVAVLAITTDIATDSRGRFTLTELDQGSLMRPVTKWNEVITDATALPRTVRRAFTQLTTGRPGAVHLSFPIDVQRAELNAADVWGSTELGRFPARRLAPDPADVDAAAELLLAARRPVLVCGGGVVNAGAETELAAVAEYLGAPVATTISGKGTLAEDHPLAVGVVGSNGGTPETREVIDWADLVVFIGCRAGSVTTEHWRHPAPGSAQIVHIDIDQQVFGVNYATRAVIAGDGRLALAALHERLQSATPAGDGNAARNLVARARIHKFDAFRQIVASTATPIRPERVVAALQALLPTDSVVVADPGTPCPYFSAYYTLHRPGRRFISNRAHGALGYSLAGVVGAHFARPEAKCVAVMGDGSFGMASGELESIVRLGLPVTLIVLSNATYGWIKAGQKAGFGGRYFSVDFTETDHAAVARAYGIESWRVVDPTDLHGALAAALESGQPALVDIVTQPLQEAAAPVSEWIA